MNKSINILIIIFIIIIHPTFSQIVQVGEGSYTTSFPGTDSAGRNEYPSGSPQLSGNAIGKPVPTNDWWSKLIKENHADNLFNYPLTLKTTNEGLIVTHIPWGVIGDSAPIEVGLTGLITNKATVSDFSDWTVTMNWNDGSHDLQATSGIGMPFLYFTKGSTDVVEIKVNSGATTISDEILIIENATNNKDFVFYGPVGSTWSQSGNIYSSTLDDKNYWSMAMLPDVSTSVSTIADEYKQYAYVFPTNTITSWSFDQSNSKITTNFLVSTEVKEGTNTNMLLGLLPHQWNNLASNSPTPSEYSYDVVRGELKTLDGNSFVVENTFKGILPTLPYLTNYSEGYNPSEMDQKISQIENDGLATWTDSYNEGQMMNRMIQTARIADQTGDFEARDKMIGTIKERLEDWLSYQSGEVAFLFYYNDNWSSIIGYPAGHGQDNNINDHHFHWGYFIHAASFIEQFEPSWADQWGGMINLLIRDAASFDREDTEFPFLRNFSPYAGHSWANGFATFPGGNDQESTSESMQFASSLIHWGTITEHDDIRDLGIYIYTTEQTAVEEYWFDIYERNFEISQPNQQYNLVSRVWGNSFDNGTFWTSDIAASYGIEMYPIHGGSLYLGHHQEYAENLWDEITTNTGILNNEVNPNLWHDTYWKYLSFIDAQAAIDLYNSNPDRALKFGISDAQTYHWLHSMNAIGSVDTSITADYPISATFNNGEEFTYVAHNYSDTPITVTFSDGFQLEVPAEEMATNRGSNISGTISSDFNQAYINGSANLLVQTENQNVSRVEYYDGTELLGEIFTYPYEYTATNLSLGMHNMYAKIYSGSDLWITNIFNIQVGEQQPYIGSFFQIPGTIESGKYDSYEGGVGQNISYYDNSQYNEGGYRPNEYVDAAYSNDIEGPTLGWIESGEWVEYSVIVETPGYYNLNFRCASDISNGGGPFYFEIDGYRISNDIYVENTGDWDNWISQNVEDIEFNTGEHIIRVVFSNGGFNLGKMTFSFDRDLDYFPPIANAGDDLLIILPETTAILNGDQSQDDDTNTLNFYWEQIYGPTIVIFSDQYTDNPEISELVEGTYKFKLTVNDGEHFSIDYVYIFVSSTSDFPPNVSLNTSEMNDSYYFGSPIQIFASANDIDGTITLVEFYDSQTKIGEDDSHPYSFQWDNATIGIHEISAHATDNDGLTSVSEAYSIEVLEAPDCTGGPDNGDYTYEFSDDLNNPTLTFIPSADHVGNPTCILYYSTSGTPPGYYVTPNIPFQINASEGEIIQFYYTYSFNGLESNTAGNPHTYEIGSCNSGQLTNEEDLVPVIYSLYQNHPNPFNPVTTLRYDLPENSFVNITIYDMIGRLVRNLVSTQQDAGYKSIRWDATNNSGQPVSAGLYLYMIQAGDFRQTKKMVLLK